MTRLTIPATEATWLAASRRIVVGALHQGRRVATALRHRREVRHLAEFDDRILKDLGLLRSDVDEALAVPFYWNPSTILMVRSVERRARNVRIAQERAIPLVRPTRLS